MKELHNKYVIMTNIIIILTWNHNKNGHNCHDQIRQLQMGLSLDDKKIWKASGVKYQEQNNKYKYH